MARAHPCQKDNGSEQPLRKFHIPPQSKPDDPNRILSDATRSLACGEVGVLSRCADKKV
jgi:hypothetical protein